MITILNEKTDWSVRAAFFDALCPVLSCIGWESVEIVKSLLEQGLRDSEEFVIHRTLNTLSKMVEIGLLDRKQIFFFLSNHITALLCHPSLWIRHGAVNFITVVCKKNTKIKKSEMMTGESAAGMSVASIQISNSNGLNTADVLCSVAPLLSKILARNDLINYDREEILFSCLKRPIKRAVYDCMAQDGRSDQLFVYLNQRSEIRCLTNQNYLPGYVDCSDPNVQQFFEKLTTLGFIEEDEDKLLYMKDFIEKTRISRLSSSLHNADNMSGSATSIGTTSIQSPWHSNSMKENFMTKDGYITIMKDKFQRCNVEHLNSRKIAGFSNSSFELSSTNQKLDNQIGSDSQSSQPESGVNIVNAEWKLMFGKAEEAVQPHRAAVPAVKARSSLKSNQPQQSESNNNTYYDLNQTLSQMMSFRNCTVEVEKYLDRAKLIYEDHKLKKCRVDRMKETVNTSISSNLTSLSASHAKWRPKGYLIAHSNEHTKEITKLSRNYDSSFFSTCSTSECSVKIWSTENLLDGKSGFFKSVFTYDKQTSMAGNRAGGQHQPADTTSIQPCCTAFYDRNSLAILGEDFRFHVIDFNSNRTQYHLYTHEKLFRPAACYCCCTTRPKLKAGNLFDKTVFYYLNKSLSKNARAAKLCHCSNNYPIEMIYLDDASPTWPIASTNLNEYFKTTSGSSTKGLFCYSTSVGDMSCIDLRTRSKAFDIKRDLRKGYITSMCADPWHTWLAMGTSYGAVELYDFRFMLPVQTFEHRSKTAVVKLCNHPGLLNRVCAAYQGNNEISIWNMDASRAVGQLNRKSNMVEPEFVFWGVQSVPPLCQNKMSSYYVSGLVGCAMGEDNGLICASTDMKIRYIDLNERNQMRDSFLVSSAFNQQQSVKGASSSNHIFVVASV